MSWAADKVIEAFLAWLTEAIVGGLDTLWNLLATTVFVSPDVTVLPQVKAVGA